MVHPGAVLTRIFHRFGEKFFTVRCGFGSKPYRGRDWKLYGYSMYYLLEWVLRMLGPDPDRAKMFMASSMVEPTLGGLIGKFQVTPSILQ